MKCSEIPTLKNKKKTIDNQKTFESLIEQIQEGERNPCRAPPK